MKKSQTQELVCKVQESERKVRDHVQKTEKLVAMHHAVVENFYKKIKDDSDADTFFVRFKKAMIDEHPISKERNRLIKGVLRMSGQRVNQMMGAQRVSSMMIGRIKSKLEELGIENYFANP